MKKRRVAKLVAESLDAYLENPYAGHKGGQIDPAFLEQTILDILDSNSSAGEKYNMVFDILDKNPYIHGELGEVPGKNKYQKALDPFIEWESSLSRSEEDEVAEEMEKRDSRRNTGRRSPRAIGPSGGIGKKWGKSLGQGFTDNPLSKIYKSLKNTGEYFLPYSGKWWNTSNWENVIAKLEDEPGVELEDCGNKGCAIQASPSKSQRIFDIISSEEGDI